MRVAFYGASGTGKTTLAAFVADQFGLQLNPVGSRSVSEAMGFASPYEVDKAGKRAEFQRRLLFEKREWEDAHDSFVSDRTTADNLIYTMMHDVGACDADTFTGATSGLARYTHLVYHPVGVFCRIDNDVARLADMTYHRMFDAAVDGVVRHYAPIDTPRSTMFAADIDTRKELVTAFLEDRGRRASSRRAETGPVQFGDDWPGCFLRGDYAVPMADALRHVLDALDMRIDHRSIMTRWVRMCRGLTDTLGEADARDDGCDAQRCRSWSDCLDDAPPSDETLAALRYAREVDACHQAIANGNVAAAEADAARSRLSVIRAVIAERPGER